MKLTTEQREKIISLFPEQRGNVAVDADHFLDALMYLVHNGCTWRSLPAVFGPLGILSMSESTGGPKTASWSGFFRRFGMNR